jgi:hypothetical protein
MDARAVSEKRALWIVSLLVAATRFLAISKTLWDWDEALFALSLNDYDVTRYHPQPPGFPLFIGAGKLLAPMFSDPFRALQTVTVLSSLFVFPVMWFLARELRATPFVAFASAALLSFAPNVWFYGGTALSDVPSMVLSLVACALLLRGCRSNPALFAGAVVLGIAAAFRPQNLVIAAVPLLLVLLRRWRPALAALLIVGTIVAASYGTAAALSGGWDVYREAVAKHGDYIRATDSFLAAGRPSLLRVADDFFVRPYRAPWINVLITILAALGVFASIRRRSLELAVFGPFCILAWLYLDYHSASRFSLGYAPLIALLAASGLAYLQRISAPLLALLLTLMIAWTWPSLAIVRTSASPPVAAMRYLAATTDPRTTIICFDESLGAHAALLLAGYQRCAASSIPPALWATRARILLVREAAGDVTFTRPRVPLANLVRDRYFEAGIVDARRVDFVTGWRAEEGNIVAPYRWMTGTRATVHLPGAARARLVLHVSGDAAPRILLNGRVISTSSDFTMDVDADASNELVIESTRPLRLDRLEWAADDRDIS